MRALAYFAFTLSTFMLADPAASAQNVSFTVRAGETLTSVFTNVTPGCVPAIGPARIRVPPRYGSIAFRRTTGVQTTNPNPACNFRRYPALAIVYTAPSRFVGEDRFRITTGKLSVLYVIDVVP